MKPDLSRQPAFWRRTPPALFPSTLGLFGLGLAWQNAGQVMGWPRGIGDLIVGMVSLLFLFAFVSYVGKLLTRPAVLSEDLRVLPARACVAALSMSLMVMAAGLLPIWPRVAGLLWVVGLALHAVFFVAVFAALLRGPAEQRKFAPGQHLSFVGFIVAPLAGVGLGYAGLSQAILWLSLAFALAIWLGCGSGLLWRAVPAPLRPMQAIHLSPVALLGLAAHLLGHDRLFAISVYGSLAVAAVLVVRIRWITEAGFSPLWGAFTFPLAAFTSLQILAYGAGMGNWALYVAMAGLAVATVSIPWIAALTYRDWARGSLAARTNAAVA